MSRINYEYNATDLTFKENIKTFGVGYYWIIINTLLQDFGPIITGIKHFKYVLSY
jgi:hypothetical protein